MVFNIIGHKEKNSDVNIEELYTRYGPMVLRRCRQLLDDEQEALDAMQDTFVAILENEKGLNDKNLSGLLYRIATNISLNKLRTRRRRPEDRDEELLMRIASVEDVESKISIKSILAKIFSYEQESTRTIAVMHFVDGMTYEEVAREVGLSVSGVRKRLRVLLKHIGELGEEFV